MGQNADLLAELESLKKENLELRNTQPLSVQNVAETPQLVNQTIGAHLKAKSVSPKIKSKKSESVVKPEVKEGEGSGKLVNSEQSESQDKKIKIKSEAIVANSPRPIAEAEEGKSKPIEKLKSKPKKRKPKKLNKGLLMFEASGGKIASPKVKSASVKKRKKKKGKRKTGKLALKFANMPVMGMTSPKGRPKGRPRSNTSPSRKDSSFEADEKKENVDTNQMIKARPCISHVRRTRTRHRLKG